MTRSTLVGCECSGIVREELRSHGVDAWSCDLKPSEDGSPHHICGDVFAAIAGGCPTDGRPWGMGIFHPPCDYLTVSGNRWFADDAQAGDGVLTGSARRLAQAEAVRFVQRLWLCGIPRVAIENPIGRLSSLWRRPTQIIQPFQFGAPHRKATCLWLRGLPRLLPSHVPGEDLFAERQPESIEATVWRMAPGPNRKADRARTYPEIARAMALAWAHLA